MGWNRRSPQGLLVGKNMGISKLNPSYELIANRGLSAVCSSISLGIAALNPGYGCGQFVARVERSDTREGLHRSPSSLLPSANLQQYLASI